jgi:hypothetical protein
MSLDRWLYVYMYVFCAALHARKARLKGARGGHGAALQTVTIGSLQRIAVTSNAVRWCLKCCPYSSQATRA